MELLGLFLAFIAGAMALNAYRSNRRMDESWERMRRELTPTSYLGRPGFSVDVWGSTWREFMGARPDWVLSGKWKSGEVGRLKAALRRHYSGASSRAPLILGDNSAFIHLTKR